MMFESTETIAEALESAFGGLLSGYGDIENERTYLETECGFNMTTELRETMISLEIRATELYDHFKTYDLLSRPIGSFHTMFEERSGYMQTSDVYDNGMEEDYEDIIPPAYEQMLQAFTVLFVHSLSLLPEDRL